MNTRLLELGFTRLACEWCIYVRRTDFGSIITGIHVNDFALAASSDAEANLFKSQLAEQWQISDLGESTFCVGIAIEHDRDTCSIAISQTALINKVTNQFNLADAHTLSIPMTAGLKLSRKDRDSVEPDKLPAIINLPYRTLVGCLMYIAIGSRPDISYAVGLLSQFLDCYSTAHWEAAKNVVRYLKGTRTLKLVLGGPQAIHLIGFIDASYAPSEELERRSISGYCFSLGFGMISWSSRKQKGVAGSSCKAEYIAASEASKECMWLRSLLLALDFSQRDPSPLLCDNNAAIILASDPSFHTRVKHIDVRWHQIRDFINTHHITVTYINTKDNIADCLTKSLPGPAFTRLRSFLGLR